MTTNTHGGDRIGSGRRPATPDAAIRRCLQRLDQAISAALARPGGHGIDYATARELWREADRLAATIDDEIIPTAKDFPTDE